METNRICNLEECTGCLACFNVCPKEAIYIEEENAFYYPKINREVCINCGLCKKICPSNNKVEKTFPIDKVAYAILNKNKEIRDTSSSGGVFYDLAKTIISSNGSVYGAAWNDELNVKHIRIDSIEKIKLLQGSKYVQSDINNSYTRAKKDLDEGKKVLFSGVPCQIAGLISFLEKDYDNLYTCEVLCHGNASPIIFNDHKEYIEKKYNSKIKNINFRFKTKEKCQNIEYKLSDGQKILLTEPINDYFYCGFQNGTLLRSSCFNCNYIGIKRCADITLADFWGLKNDAIKKEDNLSYPSLVFVNTEKGYNLFNENKRKWIIVERPIEEAIYGNLSLRRAIPMDRWRSIFFKEYKQYGYEISAKKNLIVHNNIKEIIKKILGKNFTRLILKVMKR